MRDSPCGLGLNVCEVLYILLLSKPEKINLHTHVSINVTRHLFFEAWFYGPIIIIYNCSESQKRGCHYRPAVMNMNTIQEGIWVIGYHRNSNSMEISLWSHLIHTEITTTKFVSYNTTVHFKKISPVIIAKINGCFLSIQCQGMFNDWPSNLSYGTKRRLNKNGGQLVLSP